VGSQQLYLLILSLLLVGISIYAGYNFLSIYYQDNNREQLLAKITQLHQDALLYRKKTLELGGGEGSFNSWSYSNNLNNSEKTKIDFSSYEDKIIFKATGDVIGWDGESGTEVWVRFSEKTGKTIRFLN
jgi:hypothetical protein